MAEGRRYTEPELEQMLRDLGGQLAYPPTPELHQAVRRRLTAPARPTDSWWARLGRPQRLALAAAVALVLLVGTLLVSPTAREVVADRLGLRYLIIQRVPEVPTPTPAATAEAPTAAPASSKAPTAPPLGANLRLGERMSLAEAQRQATFQIRQPSLADLGEPDAVYLSRRAMGGQVFLVYRARPGFPAAETTGVGLLLTQFRGDAMRGLLNKMVGPNTRIEQVDFGGKEAYWITGAPHALLYADEYGQVQEDSLRIVGDTLIWDDGPLTFRIESALSKEEALRVARSVQ